VEAGWTPEMSRSKRAARDSLYSMLHSLLTAVKVRSLLASPSPWSGGAALIALFHAK